MPGHPYHLIYTPEVAYHVCGSGFRCNYSLLTYSVSLAYPVFENTYGAMLSRLYEGYG